MLAIYANLSKVEAKSSDQSEAASELTLVGIFFLFAFAMTLALRASFAQRAEIAARRGTAFVTAISLSCVAFVPASTASSQVLPLSRVSVPPAFSEQLLAPHQQNVNGYDDRDFEAGCVVPKRLAALSNHVLIGCARLTPSLNVKIRGYDSTFARTTAHQFVATKTGTVFRGDGRAAAEIFEGGMTARNPAMSIEEHLAGGNGLIATSKSKFVANGFAVQNKGLTYVIDDVGGTAVQYPKNFKFMKGEQEVVFSRIEPTQIRGAYTSKGEWIPNPNYRGG